MDWDLFIPVAIGTLTVLHFLDDNGRLLLPWLFMLYASFQTSPAFRSNYDWPVIFAAFVTLYAIRRIIFNIERSVPR